MKKLGWFLVVAASLALSGCTLFGGSRDEARKNNYVIGTGMADITGPAAGVQMWGFAREDQITAGLHTRLRARAFLIAERGEEDQRVALVVADLGGLFQEVQQAVVAQLQERYGDLYRLDNVVLSATHTHSGPGGYSYFMAASPLASPFYQEHFDAIVDGIVAAIAEAHETAAPGRILVAQGEVEGAGVNRSMPAYLNNPEEERAKYEHPEDRTMTLLKFVTEDGREIGALNWFAVHPTSMTYNNRLISGDHKGYAEWLFERAMGVEYEAEREPGEAGPEEFVAAFANSNAGDITSNLNLDNTGPGVDEFDSTRIIGQRQYDKARELYETADTKLKGEIETVFDYVDFSTLEVSDEWTGEGTQRTCPSAYGYAFAAGSTEDGGGHPLFKEGMLERNAMIDGIVGEQFGYPSDGIRACHLPKVVLFAPGERNPPGQAQVLPLGLVKIGQLVLISVPAEVTTMAGRRMRETVKEALGEKDPIAVIAAYTNDYAGYVTTHEEYVTQQYEGGHTLYGPWTLAGYQQEYDRLANALQAGEEPALDVRPHDMSGEAQAARLGTERDVVPEGAAFGQVIEGPEAGYSPGEIAAAIFRTGHPQNDFRTGSNFVEVQRKINGEWRTVATDADWSTRFVWAEDPELAGASRATVQWFIPSDAEPGTYRILHHGAAKFVDGEVRPFTGASTEFEVTR